MQVVDLPKHAAVYIKGAVLLTPMTATLKDTLQFGGSDPVHVNACVGMPPPTHTHTHTCTHYAPQNRKREITY